MLLVYKILERCYEYSFLKKVCFSLTETKNSKIQVRTMNISKVFVRAFLGFFFLSLGGCATVPRGASLADNPSELPSVQQEKATLLSQLKIGSSLAEFQKLVPEAYIAGQYNQTTAYELVHLQKYVTQGDIDRQNFWWGVGSPNARTAKQVLWFYFYKDQLVKWGRPQDWPERPDIIIERRER